MSLRDKIEYHIEGLELSLKDNLREAVDSTLGPNPTYGSYITMAYCAKVEIDALRKILEEKE